jgi:hypothetical protein
MTTLATWEEPMAHGPLTLMTVHAHPGDEASAANSLPWSLIGSLTDCTSGRRDEP